MPAPAPSADTPAPATGVPAEADAHAASRPAPRRRRGPSGWHWLWAGPLLAAALAALLVLLLVAWAWQRPATLPWLLSQVPGLQVQGLQLQFEPRVLQAERLQWQLPGGGGTLAVQGLQVQGWQTRWRPHPGAWVGVRLNQVQAEHLRYTPPAQPTPPSTAPPPSLRLPVDLAVDALRLARAEVDGQPALTGVHARLTLGDAAGSRHHGELLAAGIDLGTADRPAPIQLSGRAQVQADAPLHAEAQLQASGQGPGLGSAAAPQDWHATLAVQGPLARLQAQATLAPRARPGTLPATTATPGALATAPSAGTPSTGTPAAARPTDPRPANPAPLLQATATVAPWQAWPLDTLDLRLQGLDLQALSPAWPRTALSGQAQIALPAPRAPSPHPPAPSQAGPSGQAQPGSASAPPGPTAQARIDLRNAEPGRLDAERLPLRRLRLQADGDWRQPDHLQVQALEAELGDAHAPAGRITGRGAWRGTQAGLDLRLDAVQPARLHASAAELQVGGPVRLTLQGLPTGTGKAPAAASAPPPVPEAAALAWTLDAQLEGQALAGGRPGAAPPVQLALQATGGRDHLRLHQAQARSGPARATATLDLQWSAAQWQASGGAQVSDLDPRAWWRGQPGTAWARGPHRLNGQASLKLSGAWPPATPAAATARSAPRARANGTPGAPTDTLRHWLARTGGQAQLVLDHSLLAGVPLQARADWGGPAGRAQLAAQLRLDSNRIELVGGPGATATGGPPPAAAPAWSLTLSAPALRELAPLGALAVSVWPDSAAWWPRAGSAHGQAQLSLLAEGWRSDGQLRLEALDTPQARLGAATLSWQAQSAADAPLRLHLSGQQWVADRWRLDQVDAQVQGSLRQHRLTLSADSPLRPPAAAEWLLGAPGTGSRLQAQAEGLWAPQASGGGRYRLQQGQFSLGHRANSRTSPWAQAEQLAAEALWAPGGVLQQAELAPGRLRLAGTTALRWQTARWQAVGPGGPRASAPGQLDLVGELEAFDLAPLMARWQPELGWRGDLRIGGSIEVHAGARVAADIVLGRTGGDLSLNDELGGTQALGLSDLRLAATVQDGVWQFSQGLAGRDLGTVVGAQRIVTEPGRRWPAAQAPLQGVVEAKVANLGAWGTWVPPGWRLGGALTVEGALGGTMGSPELRGRMTGRQLAVRNLLQGVDLANGQLDVALDGERARVERLVLQAGDGQLSAEGEATLGSAPTARLQVRAERFRVLSRVDRRLVVSGSSQLALGQSTLSLDGRFQVDEGLFDISRDDAPRLDNDVRVHRRADAARPGASGLTVAQQAPAPATAATAANGSDPPAPAATAPKGRVVLNLRLDLGERLRLVGHGIDTGLRGQLVATAPNNKLQVHGVVRTHEGRYAAYGQRLEISRGEIRFEGPLDNPRLDILASRPNLDVLVGVAITGGALNPRIRLYSEPELSDYDKLSWLVLGRSPDGLGNADTALLQRAAFALLSGDSGGPTDRLMEVLGLTDFSVRQTDGDTRDTIISLGKQLSRRWYVGYERSVHATTGTWQLVYRIAQRFTLRAQSGEDDAVDLIWSWRW